MTISDGSSVSVTFPPDGSSALVKYLLSSGTIGVELTQTQTPATAIDRLVPCGVKFSTPMTLGATSGELTIQPGLQGTIGIKTGALFDPKTDDFGDSVSVPSGKAYVSVAIKASLSGGVTETSGDLQFCFNAGGSITLANYRPFDTTTKLTSAIQALFQGFIIPASLQDIENMPVDAVATVEGTGSLKFSATANLAAAMNPLATLPLLNLATLSIKPAGSLSLGAAITLTGGYQVRVRRLKGRKFQLGYEKRQGDTLAVTASASTGLTAALGSFDLISILLKAIRADPVADKDTFGKQTGLTDPEIDAVGDAVKAGIERNLELCIAGEIDRSAGSSAAFSYEIDLETLDDAAKQAVHTALGGDLTGLEGADHPGVTRLTSVFGSLREGSEASTSICLASSTLVVSPIC